MDKLERILVIFTDSRKVVSLWGVIVAMMLSACYHTDSEVWDGADMPKTTNSLIYQYTMAQTLQYADMLLLTYQLKEYLRQTDENACDSVNALYFRNVRIDEQKDVLSGKPYYQLTTYWPIQTQYQMTIYDQADGTTRIEAVSRSAKGETAHNLTVDATTPERWTMTVNSSLPMEDYLMSHAFSVKSEKDKVAEFTAEWSDSAENGLAFKMTGKAAMESVAEPRLYVSYEILRPFTMYFMSDSPLYPTRYLYEEYGILCQGSYHLAYPSDGHITMKVLDSISGRPETYERDNIIRSKIDWNALYTPVPGLGPTPSK